MSWVNLKVCYIICGYLSQHPSYVINLDMPFENGMIIEGLIIDLLNKLSFKFSFTIYEQAETKYGSEEPTAGEWGGMIGDLIKERKWKCNIFLIDIFTKATDGKSRTKTINIDHHLQILFHLARKRLF